MSNLIVSLETHSLNETQKLVDTLGQEVSYYKVGLPLFVKEGEVILNFLHTLNKKVFLDLKFYDIPSVTKRAVESACDKGVFMVNVHALSGEKTLREVASLKNKYPETQFIGVTLLTSYSEVELHEEGLLQPHETVEKRVLKLAQKVKDSGLHGVVASVYETKKIKEKCGHQFLVITPGVRLDKNKTDDQSRVAPVSEALSAGADYLVVGRPICHAKDPKVAVQSFLEALRI
ncbi:MAG: orotidine-5'-phosphate decarboxylase [Deltaproteobacteria bacterium]|nr:orotidine-5'-phosphate decarboxylase [Deltaproteobacteria bacterium]